VEQEGPRQPRWRAKRPDDQTTRAHARARARARARDDALLAVERAAAVRVRGAEHLAERGLELRAREAVEQEVLRGVAVAATPVLGCSAAAGGSVGASGCLYTVANALMVPYLPGEAFKMALVLVTVPAAWALLLRVHAWRAGAAGAALAAADFSPPSALDEAAADADERGGDAAAVNVGAGGAAAAGADVDGARDAAAQNDAAALPGSALLAVRAARLA